jgi:MerR family transcriptional regulator, heat shock protein HspR
MHRQEGAQGPAQKSSVYSIKEASELTDIPPHTLRLWERKIPGFLKPVRTRGGQRRYTADCLDRIRKLDFYVNSKGLSLVGARRMIEEGHDLKGSPEQELREKILADKRVRQAVDSIVELIRKRILEEF